jgi:hypothetical protein
MSSFSVELTFKIAGREVAPDQFVEAIAAKTLENLRREIEGLRSSQAATPRVCAGGTRDAAASCRHRSRGGASWP